MICQFARTTYVLHGNTTFLHGSNGGLTSATTYFLSSDGKTIKDSQSKYEFDPKRYYEIGWTKEFLENVIIELKANNKTTSPFIDYYSKSKSKFNGVFPVSNEFDLEKQYFSETEKKEIITVGNNVYDS